MKIAVSGKGGVGKTTIAANLAKLYASTGFKVYAVDADPDSSLGLALGFDDDELAGVRPLIEMEELIDEKTGAGALFMLNPDVGDVIGRFSVEKEGVRFLRMGGIKRGGSECYCRENSFLKAVIDSLLLDSKDIVILDMSAGIEHLTRGTSACVDLMVIVSEPGRSSVSTSRIVEKLARELGVRKVVHVANKVRNERDEEFIRSNFSSEELWGIIHHDDAISEKAMGLLPSAGISGSGELESVLSEIVRRLGKITG